MAIAFVAAVAVAATKVLEVALAAAAAFAAAVADVATKVLEVALAAVAAVATKVLEVALAAAAAFAAAVAAVATKVPAGGRHQKLNSRHELGRLAQSMWETSGATAVACCQ